jgi:hypothetical protein
MGVWYLFEMWSLFAARRQKVTDPQTATNQRGPAGAREGVGSPANTRLRHLGSVDGSFR